MSIENQQKSRTSWPIILAALGIVYGDIGTSPIYALRICFSVNGHVQLSEPNILGILSLIFWALTCVVTIKYLATVMNADNKGEGGILALVTLLKSDSHSSKKGILFLIVGLFGAALLYGDSLITPAISVLSAVEGLNMITTSFQPFVIPISAAILIGLFFVQNHGSGRVGRMFGPIMLFWFLIISILGIHSVIKTPGVFLALNPQYAINFFLVNKMAAFLTLGGIFLTLTGAEALYADMGHFGKNPIRKGWFYIVFPALLLNYFGQGALLLRDPTAITNLFFKLAPAWGVIPLVILAAAATVIASQAVISGAFSLTKQAIQLGYSPRLDIKHTSDETIGQIYIPVINWLLLSGTLILVFLFQKSDNLAAAYGVAVSATMLLTTLLLFPVFRTKWKWPLIPALLLISFFLTFDLSFFISNALKIPAGGWISIAVAIVIFSGMSAWNKGRSELQKIINSETLPEDIFLDDLKTSKHTRVQGTAIFLTGNSSGIPRSLLHNYKHNKVIHKTVILLTIINEETPAWDPNNRITHRNLGQGFHRIELRFGFQELPNIPLSMPVSLMKKLKIDMTDVSYFMGRETLRLTHIRNMPMWRKLIFYFLSRNAYDASKYFAIPAGKVVELGIQVEL